MVISIACNLTFKLNFKHLYSPYVVNTNQSLKITLQRGRKISILTHIHFQLTIVSVHAHVRAINTNISAVLILLLGRLFA